MKKIFLVALLMICGMTYAQDVIIKLDGSSILAKVTEITDSQIKYKKASNPNGPIYYISKTEVQYINFENGEKEVFNQPTITEPIQQNTPPIYNSNQKSDIELLGLYNKVKDPLLYNKGKRLKNAGITIGITGIIIGGALLFGEDDITYENKSRSLYIGGIGIISGTICFFIGKNMMNKSKSLSCAPIYQQEFSLGKKHSLTADVNIIKDNIYNTHNLGLGVHLNF